MDGSVTQLRDTGTQTACPVSSHNEWDPLEEVVVGRLEGATDTRTRTPSSRRAFLRTVAAIYRLLPGGPPLKYRGVMTS